MFQQLKNFKKIIVSGPQRSGTTIASQMIAQDLNRICVDETKIRVDDICAALALLDQNESFVLQCPGLLPYLWMLNSKDRYESYRKERDDTCVVVMQRDETEILASMDRIGWDDKYEQYELMKVGLRDGVLPVMKYEAWEAQKPYVNNWFEIEYESLRGHPLWVEDRKNFRPKQTRAS